MIRPASHLTYIHSFGRGASVVFSDAVEYGSAEDKWVKNAEIFLGSILDKNEASLKSMALNDEKF